MQLLQVEGGVYYLVGVPKNITFFFLKHYPRGELFEGGVLFWCYLVLQFNMWGALLLGGAVFSGVHSQEWSNFIRRDFKPLQNNTHTHTHTPWCVIWSLQVEPQRGVCYLSGFPNYLQCFFFLKPFPKGNVILGRCVIWVFLWISGLIGGALLLWGQL